MFFRSVTGQVRGRRRDQTKPSSRARVLLARNEPSSALALLEPLRGQMEAKSWQDERLQVLALLALALHAEGREDEALGLLVETMGLAEGGGFIRLFLDEGARWPGSSPWRPHEE